MNYLTASRKNTKEENQEILLNLCFSHNENSK